MKGLSTQEFAANESVIFFVGYMSEVQRIDDGSTGEDLDYSAKSFPVDPAIVRDIVDLFSAKYQIPSVVVTDIYHFLKSGKILTHVIFCNN